MPTNQPEHKNMHPLTKVSNSTTQNQNSYIQSLAKFSKDAYKRSHPKNPFLNKKQKPQYPISTEIANQWGIKPTVPRDDPWEPSASTTSDIQLVKPGIKTQVT